MSWERVKVLAGWMDDLPLMLGQRFKLTTLRVRAEPQPAENPGRRAVALLKSLHHLLCLY